MVGISGQGSGDQWPGVADDHDWRPKPSRSRSSLRAPTSVPCPIAISVASTAPARRCTTIATCGRTTLRTRSASCWTRTHWGSCRRNCAAADLGQAGRAHRAGRGRGRPGLGEPDLAGHDDGSTPARARWTEVLMDDGDRVVLWIRRGISHNDDGSWQGWTPGPTSTGGSRSKTVAALMENRGADCCGTAASGCRTELTRDSRRGPGRPSSDVGAGWAHEIAPITIGWWLSVVDDGASVTVGEKLRDHGAEHTLLEQF